MLVALRIKDLAVIDSIEIEFEEGFTALTGETGAGKSILVDALSIALGGRASRDAIRTGAEAAEVEALFDVSDSPAARRFLGGIDNNENGKESGELAIKRVIGRSGKNRAWINGSIETTSRLAEIGSLLVDIYGQHDYHTLLSRDKHRELLDCFGGLEADLAEYAEAYSTLVEAEKEKAALDMDEAEKREREELLRFRIREIQGAGLEPGEDEKLAEERQVLRHAGELIQACQRGIDYLYESDRAACSELGGLARLFEDAAESDEWFREPAAQIEQARAILEETARDLTRRLGRIEDNPERLAWVEERIVEIGRLKRRYGNDLAEVFETLEKSRSELESIERAEDRLRELDETIAGLAARTSSLAGELKKKRIEAGKRLAKMVVKELSDLGMEETRFEARVTSLGEGRGGLGPLGGDEVEFFLSPNPGEDLKPMSRVASGGELSRIMLALRVILAGPDEAHTLVFDEVDQGIGGEVARSVGQRMKKLSEGRQVLCVTHHHQIASLASSHVKVDKHKSRNRTWTEAKRLEGEGRIEEIARMMGGSDDSEEAMAHARSLVEKASPPGPAAKSSSKSGKGGSAGR